MCPLELADKEMPGVLHRNDKLEIPFPTVHTNLLDLFTRRNHGYRNIAVAYSAFT